MAAGLLAGCVNPPPPSAAAHRVVHRRPAPRLGGTAAKGCGPAAPLSEADKIALFRQFSTVEEAGEDAPPATAPPACGQPAR